MNRPDEVLIGAVSYLNSKPLVYGLERHYPSAQLVFDLPSRLADRLVAGEFDVALIPSIALLAEPAFSIVCNACIACHGPVLSVKLYSRVPPARIRTLALDEGSRTSVALARILLEERCQVRPHLEPLPAGQDLADCRTDAVLLIGDRAIGGTPAGFDTVWDLGGEWCQWTGLPFVFATWVARRGAVDARLAAAFCAARDDGLAALDRIAATEGPALGMTPAACRAYLRDNLYFFLGPEEEHGLRLFAQLAAKRGMIPSGAATRSLVAEPDPRHDRSPDVGSVRSSAGTP